MTREFILNTLLPYKEDPSTCAFDKETEKCYYLTKDGRKCAVGKHMIEGEHQSSADSIVYLTEQKSLDKYLTQEAIEQNIPLVVWETMQDYHDKVASGASKTSINLKLGSLEFASKFKFPEYNCVLF